MKKTKFLRRTLVLITCICLCAGDFLGFFEGTNEAHAQGATGSEDIKYVSLHDQIVSSSIYGAAGDQKANSATNIFDRDSGTIWCVVKGTSNPSGYEKTVWWTMEEPVAVDAYTMTTGYEGSGNITRDPWVWTLYGRNNASSEWAVVSAVTEGNLPEERSAVSDYFVVNNPQEYKYYKLSITGNRDYNPAGNAKFVLAELSLYTKCTDLYSEIDKASIGGAAGIDGTKNPENIFDRDASTKWRVANSEESHEKSIWWAMEKPVTVGAYTLVTADDEKGCDPKAWKLYGRNNTKDSWTELSDVSNGNLTEDRSAVSQGYFVENPQKYQYYKLTINENRDGVNNTYYQISEVNLYERAYSNPYGLDDYTNLYEKIDQTSTEAVKNAFDNDASTIWNAAIDVEDADCVRTLQWSMTEAVEVDAYTFVTAANDEEKDPWEWVFYGSNDTAGEWTELSHVSAGNLTIERSKNSDIFSIENAKPYQYYRLTITNNRSNLGSSEYQFGEFMILADKQYVNAFEEIEQNSITGDEGVKETNALVNVFDNSVDTKWCVAIETGSGECERTIQWAMKKAVTLDAYAIATANDVEGKDPQKWVLYGTNDVNGEWTVLSNVTEADLPSGRKTVSDNITIDNPGEYQYFKLVISENKAGNAAGAEHYQFSELYLLLDNSAELSTGSGGGETGGGETGGGETGGGETGGGEAGGAPVSYKNVYSKINLTSITGDEGVKASNGLKNVFDNNVNTKWCVAIEAGKGECARTVQWAMTEKIQLDAYAIVTANDMVPQKNPKKWVLYGTNDVNGEWVVLSTVAEGNLPTEIKTRSDNFVIENPGEYQYYRLTVLENESGNKANLAHYQIGELILLQEGVEDGGSQGNSGSTGNQGSTTQTTNTTKDSGIAVADAEKKGFANIIDKVDKSSITGDEGVKESNGLKKAFDNNYDTKYCVATVAGEKGIRTVQWSLKEKTVLQAYAFVTGGDMPQRDPVSWELYGSNNVKGEWKLLSAVTGGNLPAERKTASNLYLIGNPASYQHYKLVLKENKGQCAKESYMYYQFAEFLMFAKGTAGSTETTYKDSGISMFAARANGLVNVYDKINRTSITGDEGVKESNGLQNIFDNNYDTKYCVLTVEGEEGKRMVQWAMRDKIALKAYALVTGNDVPQRDPWAWEIYGTNTPEGEWTLLSTVRGATLPEERKAASNLFMIDNPGEYQHYRIVFTENAGKRSSDPYMYYQLCELVLFAEDDGTTSTNSNIVKKPVKNEKTDDDTQTPVMSVGWWILIAVVVIAGVTGVVLLQVRRRRLKSQTEESDINTEQQD